jgi:aldose 1-epimerase
VGGTYATLKQEKGLWVLELREETSGQRLRILPDLGGRLVEHWILHGGAEIPLLDPPSSLEEVVREPIAWGCPILFPFPSRIREGEFVFQKRTYAFSESFLDGNHIHGLVYERPWRVASCEVGTGSAIAKLKFRSKDFSEIRKQYPFPFEIQVEYVLTPAALWIAVGVENTGSKPLPMGVGLHPYLRLPIETSTARSHCQVRVPARAQWELEGLLPTGKVVPVSGQLDLRQGRSLDGLKLDDVFTDLDRGDPDSPARCELEDEAARLRVVLEASPVFREMVVYTPPGRPSICIEPYTCATDAPNLHARGIDAGLQILAPGGRFRAAIQLRVEPLEVS